MNPPNVLVSPSNSTRPTRNPSLHSSYPFPNLPVTNLADAISIVDESINLAEKAVESVFAFLNLTESRVADVDLAVCPFNFHHWMPPESLFRHSLLCSSFPSSVDLSILDCLQYPLSLKAVPEKTKFKPLQDLEVELCFTLDNSGVFGSSFYYKDCPGVVSSASQESTFSLPGILAAECTNFMPTCGKNYRCYPILPSELCALKDEVDSWTDYPLSYSFIILRAFSCLRAVEVKVIASWIIRNSPCHGIVIDGPMVDHISTLLELCLKAISSVASKTLDSILRSCNLLNSIRHSLECQHLVQILLWLSSQLSVLYGERNGKLFVISLLKQYLLHAASNFLMFSLKENKNGSSDEVCASQIGDIQGIVRTASRFNAISVSQVAAAISALHERALLEEKINYIRFGLNLPRMQLMAECAHISSVAEEERKNRADYRPVLELDGFLWQRSQNQDSGKNKTREELLAEERDYKRRRMSYRGKNVKRSTTEVIRDIIEEQMEEIKNAGGSGCFLKGPTGADNLPQGSISSTDLYRDDDKIEDGLSVANGKLSQPSERKYLSSGDHRDFLQYSANRSKMGNDRHSRRSRSRSPHNSRRHLHSRESYARRKDLYDLEERYRHEREDSVSSSRSKRLRNDKDSNRFEHSQTNEERYSSSISRRKISGHGSKPFDDRYDPSSTYGISEDN